MISVSADGVAVVVLEEDEIGLLLAKAKAFDALVGTDIVSAAKAIDHCFDVFLEALTS